MKPLHALVFIVFIATLVAVVVTAVLAWQGNTDGAQTAAIVAVWCWLHLHIYASRIDDKQDNA